MSTGAKNPSNLSKLSPSLPPLEPGDHLTRDEFERRYDAMPNLKRAELIEGVVYIPSAVRWDYHATPHADLIGCLVFYRAMTPGVDVGANGSIRLDLDNEPQPDVTMIIDRALGGQSAISKDDYIEGAPEFIAEVSTSSVSIDLNVKFKVYRRNGVREYLIWRVFDHAIDLFALRQGAYEPIKPTDEGILRSEVFPDFGLMRARWFGGTLPRFSRRSSAGSVHANMQRLYLCCNPVRRRSDPGLRHGTGAADLTGQRRKRR